MEQKFPYLGWGIVGTPKGRQQVDEGANSKLKVSFDLPQEFGACLPEPTKSDGDVLYCLSSRSVEKYWQLGLAEYHPVFEQGQTRAGTYFGAYVNIVNRAFATPNLSKLFSALRQLSLFQYQNFIDSGKHAYTESILGKRIDAPLNELMQIAEQAVSLSPNLLRIERGETLYVRCGKGRVVDALRLILELELHYRYKQIFFSDSTHISEQMAKKKIDLLDMAVLQNGSYFIRPYQQSLAVELTEKNKIKRQLADTVRDRDAAIEAAVKHKEDEMEIKLQQVKEQLENMKAKAETLSHQAKAVGCLQEIGKAVVDNVAARAEELKRSDLSQIQIVRRVGEQDEIRKVGEQFSQQIRALSNDIQQLGMNRNKSASLGSVLFIGMAVLSFINLGLLCWMLFSQYSHKSELETIKAGLKRPQAVVVQTVETAKPDVANNPPKPKTEEKKSY